MNNKLNEILRLQGNLFTRRRFSLIYSKKSFNYVIEFIKNLLQPKPSEMLIVIIKRILSGITLFILLSITCHAQDEKKIAHSQFPSVKVLEKIDKGIQSVNSKLENATKKLLKQLQRRENKLKRKLLRKDSSLVQFFETTPKVYSDFRSQYKKEVVKRKGIVGEFMPFMDSLETTLKFINSSDSSKPLNYHIQKALTSTKSFNDKIFLTSTLQAQLKTRRELLKVQLERFGMGGKLKAINKKLYYYKQRTDAYKAVLNSPRQLQLKAFEKIKELPAFKDFFKKNSFLASVFGTQNLQVYNNMSVSNIPDLPGLQSVAQVSQMVNNNVINSSGNSGNGLAVLKSKLSAAHEKFKEFKNKHVGGGDSNDEMPDFKANEMRGKRFLQKLEVGTNLQFSKPSAPLPSTAEIAAQVAYKFHQNGSFGFGASYKLGYGTLQRIAFSHQGVGVRSFLDYRLKGKFFINGGFEYVYNTAFKNIQQLKSNTAWQSSAMFGLSKKYNINKKLKGSIVLLYDFLHKQHNPVTQPVTVRFGYNF